ncbi:hypothetical protein T265_00154 [Opisthorchis viverrini]|uniref:Uncharacterized protein n=1 Tax=Opisthorchis viverrini TaxID=6198 RepID=A0A075ADL8_OPIVI|nr:hypothetical protein T265_00154 [Opisthorchis viverrini]KER34310.1 hypothetical protein T265_00154 [Opisthorchis viverrini]
MKTDEKLAGETTIFGIRLYSTKVTGFYEEVSRSKRSTIEVSPKRLIRKFGSVWNQAWTAGFRDVSGSSITTSDLVALYPLMIARMVVEPHTDRS